jgi:hypothetical protein
MPVETLLAPTAKPRAVVNPLPPPTIVVEDGSAMTNSNSYISLADADAWLNSALWSDNWWAADDPTKTRALIYSARLLDHGFIWRGYKTTRGQGLMWPRIWTVDPDITIGYYPAITQPPNVIVGNTSGMIWPTYYPANFMPIDRLSAGQASLALRLLGTYAQTIMQGNQPYEDPGVSRVALGQGAVAIDLQPLRAQASGSMGLIDDEVAAWVAPLGSRRYTERGGIRKIRRGM